MVSCLMIVVVFDFCIYMVVFRIYDMWYFVKSMCLCVFWRYENFLVKGIGVEFIVEMIIV